MKDAMGIIYTTKDDLSLRELTTQRAVAALPVAGRYRVVDFVLSNLVNSGVRNVGVITQRNYHSLMDHLGSGKEWDLHTRNNGLFILPPFLTRENGGEYSEISTFNLFPGVNSYPFVFPSEKGSASYRLAFSGCVPAKVLCTAAS